MLELIQETQLGTEKCLRDYFFSSIYKDDNWKQTACLAVGGSEVNGGVSASRSVFVTRKNMRI